MIRSRFLRLLCIALAAAAVIVATLLFVRPPQFVVRQMVLSSAGWLMSGSEETAGKRLLRGYLQFALAAEIADRAVARQTDDDEILMRMILSVRSLVLSPRDPLALRHDPSDWPALVAGVGHCDQIDGAVAAVAAHHFKKAELFALYDKKGLSTPHTVGRVWSSQRNGWLYFDAFYARAVVYVKDADGVPHFVNVRERPAWSQRANAPAHIYSLPGWPLTSFGRTFAGYLLARSHGNEVPVIKVAEQPPGTVSAAPAGPTQTAVSARSAGPTRTGVSARPAGQKGGVLDAPAVIDVATLLRGLQPRHPRKSDEAYRRFVRAYAQARVSHLLGIPNGAAYRGVAELPGAVSDDRAAEIAATAARFASRPRL